MRRFKFRAVVAGCVLLAMVSVSGCGKADTVKTAVKIAQHPSDVKLPGFLHDVSDFFNDIAEKVTPKDQHIKASFKIGESAVRRGSLDGEHPTPTTPQTFRDHGVVYAL
ncbi:hypothetical protein [Streptomyces sp. NBC_00439]|uniref:hypothetical protein n=1 Tax=Streptomyces sp. NBC_00439 TaxID=2903650 RepID=UPI0022548EAB|nr:hypothetical protein [Streptomyces sp. NBC_00439]MCX5100870.1 hypothetical protein [Streptomyces sp. NBC_00439]